MPKSAWRGKALASSPSPNTPWANGDVPAAADLNAYGDDDRLWGGDVSAEGHNLTNLGSIAQNAWIAIDGAGGRPAMLGGWTYFGAGASPAYKADHEKKVHVRMLIKSGTMTAGTQICGPLPTPITPQNAIIYFQGAASGASWIEVGTDGYVRLSATITGNSVVILNFAYHLD